MRGMLVLAKAVGTRPLPEQNMYAAEELWVDREKGKNG